MISDSEIISVLRRIIDALKTKPKRKPSLTIVVGPVGSKPPELQETLTIVVGPTQCG